jgi:hypothetical protein
MDIMRYSWQSLYYSLWQYINVLEMVHADSRNVFPPPSYIFFPSCEFSYVGSLTTVFMTCIKTPRRPHQSIMFCFLNELSFWLASLKSLDSALRSRGASSWIFTVSKRTTVYLQSKRWYAVEYQVWRWVSFETPEVLEVAVNIRCLKKALLATCFNCTREKRAEKLRMAA